jgi:hypothetical protein
MFNSESLPPLGKEYWWLLFFDRSGDKPVQMMLLIYRKYGEKMLFNDKEMTLRKLGYGEFYAVTSGWIFDGERLQELGDGNVAVHLKRDEIDADISGERMTFSGGYPDYKLKVGDIVDLTMGKGEFLEDRRAFGVFLPPFGAGWVDIYSSAKGWVLGRTFDGTAHLQKVFGVIPYGPFHWMRIIFMNGSTASLHTLKTGKVSKTFFHRSFTFQDKVNGEIIRFDNPSLAISRNEWGWVISGKDRDNEIRCVLGIYAEKRFTMKGGGSQVYIEYAVRPREFSLRTGNRSITLDDLGGGVGTFENAYW